MSRVMSSQCGMLFFINIYFYSGEQVDGWRGPAQLYLAVSKEGWGKILAFVWTTARYPVVQEWTNHLIWVPAASSSVDVSPFLLTTGGPVAQDGWGSWQRIGKLPRKLKRDTHSLQKAVRNRGMQCVETSTACHRFVHRQPCLQQVCLANRQSWEHQWEQIGWLWGKIHFAVAAPLWK